MYIVSFDNFLQVKLNTMDKTTIHMDNITLLTIIYLSES
mgnify:CR=1 FL=1